MFSLRYSEMFRRHCQHLQCSIIINHTSAGNIRFIKLFFPSPEISIISRLLNAQTRFTHFVTKTIAQQLFAFFTGFLGGKLDGKSSTTLPTFNIIKSIIYNTLGNICRHFLFYLQTCISLLWPGNKCHNICLISIKRSH